VVASWTARSSENEESYGNRLPFIFRAINELRTAIGENFTSADLEIFVFECDMVYDPENMEDAYGHGRQSKGKQAHETIVGTTGIGLGKFTGERNTKGALQFLTLISAKIVLTSTLDETLELIQRKRRLGRTLKKPVETTDGANNQKGSANHDMDDMIS
jgi:hypothetical protein